MPQSLLIEITDLLLNFVHPLAGECSSVFPVPGDEVLLAGSTLSWRRALDAGSSAAEIARKYQLSPKLLERWRGEWRAKGGWRFLVLAAVVLTRQVWMMGVESRSLSVIHAKADDMKTDPAGAADDRIACGVIAK